MSIDFYVHRASARWTNPTALLGKFVAGVGVLNFLASLNQLSIQSDALQILESYRHIVESIGARLFGWIELGWLQISETEMHVVVLVGLITATFIRADDAIRPWEGYGLARWWLATRSRWAMVLYRASLALLLMLALPTLLSIGLAIVVGSAGFTYIVVGATRFGEEAFDADCALSQQFLYFEVPATLGFCAIAVLADGILR